MSHKISRRTLLKTVSGASAGLLLPAGKATAAKPRILPLTFTSGVYKPPRGKSFQQFSFDFPEPSVEFEGVQISFRLHTFENAYGMDQSHMTVEEKNGGLEVSCSRLVWGGKQEAAPGMVTAQIRKKGPYIEWSAHAEMERPIKSIAAIVRGVPRGKISGGGAAFRDHRDDEVLLGYPFSGGSLFVAAGFNTPLAVIQSGEKEWFFLSALNDRVRANRFYFQPGEEGYRVELIYEKEGWEKSMVLDSPVWRVGKSTTLEGAFRPHFEHVERTFNLPDWEERTDVPNWLRKTDLVLALHGMHWTGYIFNDFAKMQKILEWTATQISSDRVLVFLPAWDGRYYWNYPLYEPDVRMGGDEGFRTLISSGQKLGYHFMPMFGTNAANDRLEMFSKVADAKTAQIDGDPLYLNWVDWDNDRHNEGQMPYMNIGVDSWRNWLGERISNILSRFHVDAYFLDISGGWENNTRADMHEGIRRLVSDLGQKHPGVVPCGEMYYDALMSVIPLYQVFSESTYPGAVTKYVRTFEHLSHPAPGRGSSGVHESGFGRFDPQTLGLTPHQIPTITVVDDTFDRHRDVMAQIIARAKQRAGLGF